MTAEARPVDAGHAAYIAGIGPKLHLPVAAVRALEEQRDTALRAAQASAETARHARQRVTEIVAYLTVMPDDTSADEIRREVNAIARGEKEPGRDPA